MNKATKRKMKALDNLEVRINTELKEENEKLKEYNKEIYSNLCKAENERFQLGIENEKLQQESKDWENKYFDCQESYNALSTRWADLKEENEKLKEALKKCDPYTDAGTYCYNCGRSGNRGHDECCEYIKLCGEVRDNEKV